MKTIILFIAVAGCVQAVSYGDVLEEEWNRFVVNYDKQYNSEDEYSLRRQIFEDNKAMIDKHNRRFHKGEETYEMGVNQFTDLLPKEFANQMLSSLNISEIAGLVDIQYTPSEDFCVPSSVDWRKKGAVTSVKNQGQCGSCWAFSAVGTLEGQHFRKTGQLVPLSAQNLVDCSNGAPYNNHGCLGGWPLSALRYIHDNGGIDTESSYPYKAATQPCRFDRRNIGATVNGYAQVSGQSEANLAAAIADNGPISVAVDSTNMQFYHSGVFNNPSCRKQPNHAMVVVGYGNDKSGGDFWLVKNSWGVSYGENGYIRMSRNRNNQCWIASYAIFPLV